MSLRLAWSTQSQDSQGSVRRPPSQNKTNKQTPAKYHFLFFHIALFYFASSFPLGASQVNVYIFLMEDVGTQFAIRKTGQRHRIFLVCPCSGPNPQSAGHSNFSVINPFGPSVCPGCLCCSPGLATTQATHECTILARALDPGVLWPCVVAEANPQHRPDSLRKLWVNIAPCFWWQDTRSQRILTSFARTGTFKPLCLWPGIPRSLPTLPTGHHRADAIKCGFYRSHNKFRNSIIM